MGRKERIGRIVRWVGTPSRLLAKLLFEVSPADPISMIGSALLLLAVALVAAYIPARHATRVDPVQALRAD